MDINHFGFLGWWVGAVNSHVGRERTCFFFPKLLEIRGTCWRFFKECVCEKGHICGATRVNAKNTFRYGSGHASTVRSLGLCPTDRRTSMYLWLVRAEDRLRIVEIMGVYSGIKINTHFWVLIQRKFHWKLNYMFEFCSPLYQSTWDLVI